MNFRFLNHETTKFRVAKYHGKKFQRKLAAFFRGINRFSLLDETEAGTACDRIALNFEHQDESSSQITMQKDVLSCMS